MDELDNYLKFQNENLKNNRNYFYNFDELNHNNLSHYSQIFSHPCCCHFHCQHCNHCKHSLYRNISFSKISHINPTISDSSLNFNYSSTNNNSLIYLNKEENNTLKKPKEMSDSKNNNLNEVKTKKYRNLKRSETEGYYFRRNKLKNKFIYNHDIKKKNLIKKDKKIVDKKNNEIQPLNLSDLKRKKLAQYYHIVNLKKYSYGGDQLETVNEANNHKYIEIKGTSSNKSLSINFKDKIKINFDYKDKLNIEINDNNNSNFTTNNNTSIINNNIENDNYNLNYNYNFKYMDYPFKTSQISPKFSNKNAKNEELKSSKILKETYNTRFVDLKNLKNSPSQQYLYNSNEDIIFSNNKIKESIKKDIPINNKDDNLKEGNNNNVYLKTYDSNLKNKDSINNKYNFNKRYESNNLHKINSYQSKKVNSKKYNYVNFYDLKTNLKNKYNIQNENNDFNSKKDNFDQNSLKLKEASVKSKKINEEPKKDNNMILKNKKYLEKFLTTNNQTSQYINDNMIHVKKKKSLEEKEIKKEKNNENTHLNNDLNNNENKILYNIIKGIKDKNTDHNKIIIKSKSKIWKP